MREGLGKWHFSMALQTGKILYSIEAKRHGVGI
jgi:hypothetical protein